MKRGLRSLTSVDDIVYIPFAKSTVLGLRLALGLRVLRTRATARLLKLILSKETLALAIFMHRLEDGLAIFAEHGLRHRVLEDAARVLTRGSLRVEMSKLLYHDEGHDVDVPVHLASALASETAALLLALNTLKPGHRPLILLEEPEAQLHPRLQLAIGIVLAALTDALNARIAITTHSDLIAFSLAYIKAYSPDQRILAQMLAEATGLPEHDESIARLAGHAARLSSKALKVYIMDEGKAREITAEKMLEEMPSIGEATSIVLSAIMEPA